MKLLLIFNPTASSGRSRQLLSQIRSAFEKFAELEVQITDHPGHALGLPSHQDRQAKLNRAGVYARHRPETTLLYQIIQEYWPEFQAELASHGRYLPAYVTKEFDEYLKCGRLEYGFLRVRCETCHDEKLVAFSCKRRGFCASCGARRMADSAALLVDEVLPHQPSGNGC